IKLVSPARGLSDSARLRWAGPIECGLRNAESEEDPFDCCLGFGGVAGGAGLCDPGGPPEGAGELGLHPDGGAVLVRDRVSFLLEVGGLPGVDARRTPRDPLRGSRRWQGL